MSFFGYIVIFFMLATLVVLALGVITMGRGGEFSKKYGNKLMVLRVVMQALALILLLCLFFVKK